MPVEHKIDKDNNLILTSWIGEPTNEEMVEAYNKYYQEIKCKPEYEGFHEIVDFKDSQGSFLTFSGIREVLRIAAKYDSKTTKTKLALVSESNLIFNMALVYSSYRGLLYDSGKEVKVFRELSDAYKWVAKRSSD